MTIEQGPADAAAPAQAPAPPEPASGRGLSYRWFLLIGIVIILDIAAFIVVPPDARRTPRPARIARSPPASSRTPSSSRRRTRVYDFDPANAPPADALVTFHPAISNTILTMWIVMAVVLVAVILMVRGSQAGPARPPEHHRDGLRADARLRRRHRRAGLAAVHPDLRRRRSC